MYEREYRKLVLDDFEKKLAAGLLAPELTAPTRAGLRDHCSNVCRERYEKKDEPLLQSFYGARENPAAYLIAVQNCDAEDFRNLNNFLRDRSKGTAFKNISMLAWMIGFEPRPFREDLKVPVPSEPQEPLASKVEAAPEPTADLRVSEPVNDTTEPGPTAIYGKFRRRWPWLAALLLLIIIIYYFEESRSSRFTGKEGCMLWTGEQYRLVSCGYSAGDRLVKPVLLDTAVQRHFKKIMQDDTLTANAIGKVWCVRINGRYEYYTDSAAHPLYPEKRLRRLTRFIMNNNRPSGSF